jgi:hypothetical protein
MLLSFPVTEQMEARAAHIRRERDKKYGNIYEEALNDKRWVGDLGEICFNNWLKQNGVIDFKWHLDNAAGNADFTILGKNIDVKTVKRKGPPLPGYTAQITAQHRDSPVDELFFLSYEFEIKKMWFLGGITKLEFLNKATYYKAGEQVHSNYTIRQGHEIYNADINILIPPDKWLMNFNNYHGDPF